MFRNTFQTHQRPNVLHERRKSDSERILLLKDDLKTFKIDHNIEVASFFSEQKNSLLIKMFVKYDFSLEVSGKMLFGATNSKFEEHFHPYSSFK